MNVLLAADEIYISRLVLRTLKFMILQDSKSSFEHLFTPGSYIILSDCRHLVPSYILVILVYFLFIVIATFQLQALNVGIGLRLPKCLASKDDEVKYWALSVAHEFIQHPRWRHQFIESRAFAQVINIGLLIMSRKPLKTATEILPAKEYIVDILVTMWGSGKTTISFMC